ncbi:hypothetical protein G6F37_012526 [Rhizopus arrhizus]|nr:hypothetical protein G6F37_012526 [Rhizopus arrhizus]
MEEPVTSSSVINEALAAMKRDASSSAQDERKPRSGKRVKVHDTIPTNHPARIKKVSKAVSASRPKDSVKLVPETTSKQGVTEKPMLETSHAPEPTSIEDDDSVIVVCSDDKLLNQGILPADEVDAEDALNANIFRCSLKQLNQIPGFRTKLIKLTRKKQKNPRRSRKRAEVFQVKAKSPVINALQENGGGAPGTEVIVAGKVKVDAVLDGGASNCIMSSRLAETLGVGSLEPVNCVHGLADGSSVKPLGQIRDLLIQIQSVKVTISPVVFDKPSFGKRL